LALEALPKDMNNPDRPYVPRAEHRLYRAFYSPRERYILPHERVRYVEFSPDGKWLVTASGDYTVRLWNADNGKLITVLQGHTDEVSHATFSPDGKWLVTASRDKTARLWDADSGKLIAILQGHTDYVSHATFTPDGKRVVTASLDNTARLWNVNSGELIATLQGHKSRVTHAEFSPDGKWVVTASPDNTARLWDANSGELIAILQGHVGEVNYAEFSPDSKRVVTASNDYTARLWNVNSGELIAILQGHTDFIIHAEFNPDGKLLVTASSDKTARLWDADNGKLITILQGHTNKVTHATFSPDGKRLVTASSDNTARLWDTNSGELIAILQGQGWDARSGELSTLQGHTNRVTHAMFSPDGKRVVTASLDNTARLWDADSGELITTLQGHTSGVVYAIFSPDGQQIVTASSDNTAKIWKTPSTQALIDEANRQKPRDLVTIEREQLSLPVLDSQALEKALEKITQGKQLAENGDFTAAQNAFKQAIQLDKRFSWYFDPTIKAQVLTTNGLLVRGQELAKNGKIEEATAVFTKVLAINANFAFNPKINDPKTKAKQIAASALVSKGEFLAEAGKVDEAVKVFKRARKLDSGLTFDLQRKTKAHQQKGKADALVIKGRFLAKAGKVDKAIMAIQRAQELDANVEISVFSLNNLCWYSSLFGQAANVLEYCEMAVKLTDERDAEIRDSRGLARALTGDFKGAITDFEFFVQHTDSEDRKKQRQDWINALKKGNNPFAQEVLESLK